MTRLGLLLLGLAAVDALPLAAQSASHFEIASIKPSAVDARAPDNSEIQPSGRVIITNLSLDDLVRGVFEVQRHQLVVGDRVPSWFASEKWDITALGPPLTPDEASQKRVRTMMQNLLIERFKLVTRRERRDTPVYALVVAREDRRLGPQLRPSSADCAALASAFKAPGARQTPFSPVCGLHIVNRQLRGTGVEMVELTRTLSRIAGRPVIDATGLTGSFDLQMPYTADDVPDPVAGAFLFTAIQEQLGLRLEPRQAPVEVLVIDSVERPTPD
jgi:uncharacterized protein (TIGR03435 family)